MNKKGFTLVEIIVVLIIIAVLAAIAIPSLTGYIQDAREKVVLTDIHTVHLAVQSAVAQEKLAQAVDLEIRYKFGGVIVKGASSREMESAIYRLMEKQMPKDDAALVHVNENKAITQITYHSKKSNISITKTDNGYTVGEFSPSS